MRWSRPVRLASSICSPKRRPSQSAPEPSWPSRTTGGATRTPIWKSSKQSRRSRAHLPTERAPLQVAPPAPDRPPEDRARYRVSPSARTRQQPSSALAATTSTNTSSTNSASCAAAGPTEAAALIAALRAEDRALWGCAFYAGLRRGELRALIWNDVELADGLIHVERSMSGHGETHEPKSRAGRRGVPIVAALCDLLVEHKLVTRRDTGLVFGSSATQPFTPTAVRKRALTAWRRPGLDPIGLHECRHTFASLLIAAGVNAKAITAYLGHASIQTTFDLYGHLMPGNEDEAVALVDAYLARADTRPRLNQLAR